jgi:methionine-rich copper-binding protein CopC
VTGAAWSRLTAVAVLLGLALVAGTGAAAAHSYPVNSDPADSDSLTSGPPRVSITFNEALQTSFDSLSVVGPDGNRWSAGNADVRGAVVSIALNPLGPAGRYTIAYRVVSADSHPVAGTRSFTLTTPGTGTPGPKADSAANTGATGVSAGGVSAWPFVLGAVVICGGGLAVVLRGRRRARA